MTFAKKAERAAARGRTASMDSKDASAPPRSLGSSLSAASSDKVENPSPAQTKKGSASRGARNGVKCRRAVVAAARAKKAAQERREAEKTEKDAEKPAEAPASLLERWRKLWSQTGACVADFMASENGGTRKGTRNRTACWKDWRQLRAVAELLVNPLESDGVAAHRSGIQPRLALTKFDAPVAERSAGEEGEDFKQSAGGVSGEPVADILTSVRRGWGEAALQIAVWRLRDRRLPVPVETTGLLLDVLLRDPVFLPGPSPPTAHACASAPSCPSPSERLFCPVSSSFSASSLCSEALLSSPALRLAYAMSIVRAVNRLVDSAAPRSVTRSVASVAAELGLHQELVQMRHDATHQSLPALSLLREGALAALDHLLRLWWAPQLERLNCLLGVSAETDAPHSGAAGYLVSCWVTAAAALIRDSRPLPALLRQANEAARRSAPSLEHFLCSGNRQEEPAPLALAAVHAANRGVRTPRRMARELVQRLERTAASSLCAAAGGRGGPQRGKKALRKTRKLHETELLEWSQAGGIGRAGWGVRTLLQQQVFEADVDEEVSISCCVEGLMANFDATSHPILQAFFLQLLLLLSPAFAVDCLSRLFLLLLHMDPRCFASDPQSAAETRSTAASPGFSPNRSSWELEKGPGSGSAVSRNLEPRSPPADSPSSLDSSSSTLPLPLAAFVALSPSGHAPSPARTSTPSRKRRRASSSDEDVPFGVSASGGDLLRRVQAAVRRARLWRRLLQASSSHAAAPEKQAREGRDASLRSRITSGDGEPATERLTNDSLDADEDAVDDSRGWPRAPQPLRCTPATTTSRMPPRRDTQPHCFGSRDRSHSRMCQGGTGNGGQTVAECGRCSYIQMSRNLLSWLPLLTGAFTTPSTIPQLPCASSSASTSPSSSSAYLRDLSTGISSLGVMAVLHHYVHHHSFALEDEEAECMFSGSTGRRGSALPVASCPGEAEQKDDDEDGAASCLGFEGRQTLSGESGRSCNAASESTDAETRCHASASPPGQGGRAEAGRPATSSRRACDLGTVFIAAQQRLASAWRVVGSAVTLHCAQILAELPATGLREEDAEASLSQSLALFRLRVIAVAAACLARPETALSRVLQEKSFSLFRACAQRLLARTESPDCQAGLTEEDSAETLLATWVPRRERKRGAPCAPRPDARPPDQPGRVTRELEPAGRETQRTKDPRRETGCADEGGQDRCGDGTEGSEDEDCAVEFLSTSEEEEAAAQAPYCCYTDCSRWSPSRLRFLTAYEDKEEEDVQEDSSRAAERDKGNAEDRVALALGALTTQVEARLTRESAAGEEGATEGGEEDDADEERAIYEASEEEPDDADEAASANGGDEPKAVHVRATSEKPPAVQGGRQSSEPQGARQQESAQLNSRARNRRDTGPAKKALQGSAEQESGCDASGERDMGSSVKAADREERNGTSFLRVEEEYPKEDDGGDKAEEADAPTDSSFFFELHL
ncbi:hypothetical protein BESB_048850 [Besnoitia besnoiti]|uniref:Las1 family protein n=1 Tax=Besnoitia besnoiti TaxID=94643 RepID=A0A2A9MLT2_BESBE|nr:hypothetical protein BESB_048850 [Besnoitia besnoiti]PFH36693.1 hypothetical protein BESB_048850 [Besnoitia besnoiti]